MNTRRLLTLTTLALALGLAGCTTGRPLRDPFHGGGASAAAVKIFVTNLNFTQVTVYGVTTGSRQRLGIVEGKGEAAFNMPLNFSTQIYLEIDILAGPTCLTERLSADPGDEFEITIHNGGTNLYCRAPL